MIYTLTGTVEAEMERRAIERIKMFDPTLIGERPYYVAYSGGKDSDAVRILCEVAGVKYDLVHNHTTLDAPETVRYVRGIPGVQINRSETTAWELIVQKLMPPTRIVRYCCEHLKEHGGEGRRVITGVRWVESVRRKRTRGGVEVQTPKRAEGLILNADNDESRRELEHCPIKGKVVVNPIIDWPDYMVWDFLSYYGCESNPLYQEGYSRVGCVGCPLAGPKQMLKEFVRWPKYKDAYIRTFDRMIAHRIEVGKETTWTCGEECFNWWTKIPKRKTAIDEIIDVQICMPLAVLEAER